MVAATALTLFSGSLAVPMVNTLSTVNDFSDIQINYDKLLNSSAGFEDIVSTTGVANSPRLKVRLHNNFPTDAPIFVYIQGLVSNTWVFYTKQGNWHQPNPNGSTKPVRIGADIAIPLGGKGSVTELTMPSAFASGRVFFSQGEMNILTVLNPDGTIGITPPSVADLNDPSKDVNWGFVELTHNEDDTIYSNLSYVDFVGLIASMSVSFANGKTVEVSGLKFGAVQEVCNKLKQQSQKDGKAWDQLCIYDSHDNSKLVRVVAPIQTMDMDKKKDLFKDYFSKYIDQVWEKFRHESLTVDGQNQFNTGKVTCKVNGDVLNCDGETFTKPSAKDIFGCSSGTFYNGGSDKRKALTNRLCAAFHRGTYLLANGNNQPQVDPALYYTTDPSNHYSRIVHELEAGGHGYAFAYDDVNPTGHADASGTIAGANPTVMDLWVGGK